MTALAFDAVDLCAGPGGWDVAAHRLGLTVLGYEIDEAAILTRDAEGHHTAIVECEPSKAHPRGVRGLSMTEVDPREVMPTLAPSAVASFGRGRGQIASPPCQGFSMAGKGQARADSERLLRELESVRTLADLEAVIEAAHEWMSHEGTALVLEPLRWAMAATPSWLAWEQVATVLPVWEACAVILRRLGYSVATGVLSTEQYGVPQTRRRAILVARAPWLTKRLGPVPLPTPTHSRYHNRTPEKVDAGLPRWVSMAEALGWGATERPSMTVTGGGSSTGGAEPYGNGARQGLQRERDEGRWQLATGTRPGATVRGEEQLAPALAFGNDAASHVWTPAGMTPAEVVEWKAAHPEDVVNNQSGTPYDVDGQVATPNDGIRLQPVEAAVLQTFPETYRWAGNKGKVFQQIGNAVPPLFAEAVLSAVLGLPFDPSPAGV